MQKVSLCLPCYSIYVDLRKDSHKVENLFQWWKSLLRLLRMSPAAPGTDWSIVIGFHSVMSMWVTSSEALWRQTAVMSWFLNTTSTPATWLQKYFGCLAIPIYGDLWPQKLYLWCCSISPSLFFQHSGLCERKKIGSGFLDYIFQKLGMEWAWMGTKSHRFYAYSTFKF